MSIPSLPALADRVGDRLVRATIATARPGTAAGRILDTLQRLPTYTFLAWLVFSLLILDAANAQVARGYPAAWLVLLAIPIGLAVVRRPVLLGIVMAAAGFYLRALYLGYPETCDQLAVSRAALGVVQGGAGPWGFGYAESVPPGAPYPYGPLAVLTSIVGVPGEVVAMTGILLILAWQRALLTAAFLAAWVSWIELGICGINDQIPALLLLGGLLLLERRRATGAVLVALSAGIKPYSAAWFPPLLGYGGLWLSAVLLGTAFLAWLPGLLWGPTSFLRSVELARGIHPKPENTLNMPALRVLAVPVAIAALWVRHWSTMVLTGALIFLIVLFLDFWASFGYWLVVLPPVGIVVERALHHLGDRLRSATGPGPETEQRSRP
jgi:hypothetical protein